MAVTSRHGSAGSSLPSWRTHSVTSRNGSAGSSLPSHGRGRATSTVRSHDVVSVLPSAGRKEGSRRRQSVSCSHGDTASLPSSSHNDRSGRSAAMPQEASSHSDPVGAAFPSNTSQNESSTRPRERSSSRPPGSSITSASNLIRDDEGGRRKTSGTRLGQRTFNYQQYL
jgi:hypothetical protein